VSGISTSARSDATTTGTGDDIPTAPRLLDEHGAAVAGGLAGAPRLTPAGTTKAGQGEAEPALHDLPEGMDGGPVGGDWGPAILGARRRPASALNWIAGGLLLMLLGWLVLSAIGFVGDQFARGPTAGWITLAVFAAGLLAVLRGAWIELASLRRLRGVAALRAALQHDGGPVGPARALALDWLERLPHLPEAAAARADVAAAADLAGLRLALRRHLEAPLRDGARRLGRRAAIEGGALVAISPSPALDGLLGAWRGLVLLRQVAALHGLRPGGVATLALLRRLAWTAAGVASLDLAGRVLAEGVLAGVPGLRHLAQALPGAGLAAARLRHLADVAAKACSPLG